MRTFDKIKSPAELSTIIQREKAAGKKAVFTNGCFDIIHVGHARYLKFARELGDLLIVALNTDESVKQLKGPSRPILRLDERLRIMAAFWMVDYVTFFAELDPWNLINQLRPNVLVKGGDYKVDEIVGRDIVWAEGGEVITAPHFKGAATTEIINRILQNFGVK